MDLHKICIKFTHICIKCCNDALKLASKCRKLHKRSFLASKRRDIFSLFSHSYCYFKQGDAFFCELLSAVDW